MKICSKCKVEKEETEFSKDNRSPTGLQCSCKECQRQYRQANKNKICEYKHKYYQTNITTIRQKKRIYNRVNADKIKAHKQSYYHNNIDTIKAKQKAYYENNKDEINEYRQNNKDKKRLHDKRYYQKHTEQVKTYQKQYNRTHIDKVRKRHQEYHQRNADKIKAYYQANKESRRIYKKTYCQRNREKIRAYVNHRYSTDVCFKLKQQLRHRLYDAIFNNYKNGSGVRDLGCSIDELKIWLESQFQPGMTWKNWGSGENDWQIDHIIPFHLLKYKDKDGKDYMSYESQRVVCHYKNLRPMWRNDNLARTYDDIPNTPAIELIWYL